MNIIFGNTTTTTTFTTTATAAAAASAVAVCNLRPLYLINMQAVRFFELGMSTWKNSTSQEHKVNTSSGYFQCRFTD